MSFPPSDTKARYFLLEIERKKTADRVYKEKITRYEELFCTLEEKGHDPNNYMVLVVYVDIWFNVFLRPQQYTEIDTLNHIHHIELLLTHLTTHYCHDLLEHRYRFIGFHNFSRLNEQVWLKPGGEKAFLFSS